MFVTCGTGVKQKIYSFGILIWDTHTHTSKNLRQLMKNAYILCVCFVFNVIIIKPQTFSLQIISLRFCEIYMNFRVSKYSVRPLSALMAVCTRAGKTS